VTDPVEAYPLTWAGEQTPPPPEPEPSHFKVTLGAAIRVVRDEVYLLGGRELIISSNIPLRRYGTPHSESRAAGRRGVAAYSPIRRSRCASPVTDGWASAKRTSDSRLGATQTGSLSARKFCQCEGVNFSGLYGLAGMIPSNGCRESLNRESSLDAGHPSRQPLQRIRREFCPVVIRFFECPQLRQRQCAA
jgi:hypothetical protein